MSTEQTPLLHSDGDRRSSDEQDKPVKIDRIALGCLLLQHISRYELCSTRPLTSKHVWCFFILVRFVYLSQVVTLVDLDG